MKRLQELIEHERKLSVSMIEDKESQMPLLEDEFYKAEQRYKQCVSNEGLTAKKLELSKEYPWAVVIHYEKELEDKKKIKTKSQSKRDKIQAKIDESEQELADVESNYNVKKKEVAECHKLLTNHNGIIEETEKTFRDAATKYKSVQLEIKKFSSNLDKRKKEKNIWESKLNEQKKENDKDHGQEREMKNKKIKEVEDKLNENSILERTKQDERKRYEAELERLTKIYDEKKWELSSSESKIKTKQKEIEDFKRASKNKILRFGNYMANLVDDIKLNYQQKNFKELPKGPIGMHIEVKDTKWSKAIEQCIG